LDDEEEEIKTPMKKVSGAFVILNVHVTPFTHEEQPYSRWAVSSDRSGKCLYCITLLLAVQ